MAMGWRGQYARYKSYFLNILAVYKQKQDLKMFLEILLSLATVSFFGAFALRPTVLTIANLLTEIEKKEEVVAQMDTKIVNLERAQETYAAEGFRIPIVLGSVPELPEPERFVRQLEALASSRGVSILGVSFGETVVLGSTETKKTSKEKISLPEGAKGIDFSLSVTGNYQDLLSFATSVENLRRPIKVDLFGVTSAQSETASSIVLVVSGRVPYLGN